MHILEVHVYCMSHNDEVHILLMNISFYLVQYNIWCTWYAQSTWNTMRMRKKIYDLTKTVKFIYSPVHVDTKRQSFKFFYPHICSIREQLNVGWRAVIEWRLTAWSSAVSAGNTYNIPMCLWLMDTHPYNPPMVFVKPTSTMMLKTGRHIDSNGRVYLPYLHVWKHVSYNPRVSS